MSTHAEERQAAQHTLAVVLPMLLAGLKEEVQSPREADASEKVRLVPVGCGAGVSAQGLFRAQVQEAAIVLIGEVLKCMDSSTLETGLSLLFRAGVPEALFSDAASRMEARAGSGAGVLLPRSAAHPVCSCRWCRFSARAGPTVVQSILNLAMTLCETRAGAAVLTLARSSHDRGGLVWQQLFLPAFVWL
jgi:hypothetical protein